MDNNTPNSSFSSKSLTGNNVVKSPFSNIDIPAIDVFTFMKTHLLQHPEDILLTSASTGETLSAKRIIYLAERVASALAKRGVGKGDGVTVIASNCVEYIITCFATLALGAVFAPVYTSLNEVELKRQAEAVEAKVIACTSNFLDTARKVYHESDAFKILIVFDTVKENYDATTFTNLATDDGSAFKQTPEIDVAINTAIVQNSSGSTGTPKGIVLTHQNTVAQQLQLLHEAFVELEPGDTTMLQAPLAHAGGLHFSAFKCMLQRANCVVVADFDICRDLSLVKKYNMKYLYLTAWHVASIAKGNVLPAPDLTSVRSILTGGSYVSAEIEDMFRRRTGVVDIRQGYGSTEGGTLTTVPKGKRVKHPGSVGVQLPNVQIKITDPSTGFDLPPTSEGEICIKNPALMKGYLNAPAATASVIDADGWFHTGDVGCFSSDGHLFITDRIKELISYKDGQHVAPALIEGILLTHPAVFDCVVVGVSVGEGVEPRAFVVLQPDTKVSAQDLEDFVAARTTVLNRLRGGVRFLKEIPLTSSGKKDKNTLRKL